MMHYGGKEMAASFRTVRGNTLRIAEDIPENHYDFQASPDIRSVRQTLVHIGLLHGYQHRMHSSSVDDLKKVNFSELAREFSAEEAKPRTKAEVIALLTASGDEFAAYLEGLSDSFLAEQVTMPPGGQPASKSRLEMLLSVKEHEMHHRGQLMVMQRLLGMVPHLTRQMQERMAQAQSVAKLA